MKRVPKESGAMKNILISAFLELMRQKKYTEITVTDIVKCAGVSRMAYYRAFSDVYKRQDGYIQAGKFPKSEGSDRRNGGCKNHRGEDVQSLRRGRAFTVTRILPLLLRRPCRRDSIRNQEE